ncbi:MAG TPA: YceI family protein, partial [Phycisphaerales bacterium]|nr:YceI family protein [Phycisphaerales bacterium]
KKLLVSLALLGLASAAFAADTWTVDTRHSGVTFSVRNFFVPVEGTLKLQEGKIVYDPADPAANSVEAVIAVTSINTQDADRDKHLNNQDFFLTEKFPTATFKSTKWEAAGANKFKVTGDLTIKDVTKPVTLDVTLLGTGPGPRGSTISGWQAATKISRKEFGVSYGPSIADEVSITINVQGIKQAPAAAKQG